MEYNNSEKQALALMKRTDFKNISKADVMSITSVLSELRPEVARDIVAQFPEFAGLLKASLGEYRNMMTAIIDSDDDSLNSFYNSADKAQENDAKSRSDYYDFAEKVLADYSKLLDDPKLSNEDKLAIADNELEVMKMVGEKDTEIRSHEEKVVERVDKKDREKREYNREMIKIASAAIFFTVSVGVTALGGNVKIPKIKL